MKRLKKGIFSITALIMLSGCSPFSNDVNIKKKDVENYNALVETTVDNYVTSKIFAEKNKEDLLNFVLNDKEWSLVKNLETTFEELSEDEVEAFKMRSIVYDKYFTALGADGVREVIILTGSGYRAYITIIWGSKEIYSINRVVMES